MVLNIKISVSILLINLGFLSACGGSGNHHNQGKQSRQSSDEFSPNRPAGSTGIAKKNSSDAQQDQADDLSGSEVDEEEIQASQPAVISGSHLACVSDSGKPNHTNCTISSEGLRNLKIEDKSLFLRLGSNLIEVSAGELQEDGSYEFFLESGDANGENLEDAKLYVLTGDSDVLEQIAKL
ncbi:MAG: hypothetical protein AB8G05_18570 [Oligoflexales bacterium]